MSGPETPPVKRRTAHAPARDLAVDRTSLVLPVHFAPPFNLDNIARLVAAAKLSMTTDLSEVQSSINDLNAAARWFKFKTEHAKLPTEIATAAHLRIVSRHLSKLVELLPLVEVDSGYGLKTVEIADNTRNCLVGPVDELYHEIRNGNLPDKDGYFSGINDGFDSPAEHLVQDFVDVLRELDEAVKREISLRDDRRADSSHGAASSVPDADAASSTAVDSAASHFAASLPPIYKKLFGKDVRRSNSEQDGAGGPAIRFLSECFAVVDLTTVPSQGNRVKDYALMRLAR